MTENIQADSVQRRQAVFVRCCLKTAQKACRSQKPIHYKYTKFDMSCQGKPRIRLTQERYPQISQISGAEFVQNDEFAKFALQVLTSVLGSDIIQSQKHAKHTWHKLSLIKRMRCYYEKNYREIHKRKLHRLQYPQHTSVASGTSHRRIGHHDAYRIFYRKIDHYQKEEIL